MELTSTKRYNINKNKSKDSIISLIFKEIIYKTYIKRGGIMLCPKCQSRLNPKERIKAMNRKKGEIHCSSCKNTFTIKKNSGRLMDSCFVGIIVFVTIFIASYVGRIYFNNSIVVPIVTFGIDFLILVVYFYISQSFVKYEIEDDK